MLPIFLVALTTIRHHPELQPRSALRNWFPVGRTKSTDKTHVHTGCLATVGADCSATDVTSASPFRFPLPDLEFGARLE